MADILMTLIDTDPEQPRKHFDEESIAELAGSFDDLGQLQPITVRPVGDRFVIVQGERRYRAALLLERETIRAEVREFDEAKDAYLASIVENVQREDLTPVEEARAIKRLIDEFKLSQAEAGRRIGGKSRTWVTQKLRLLNLTDDAISLVDGGDLTEGHARQLLKLNKAEKSDRIDTLAQRAVSETWSVARLQSEVDWAIAGDSASDDDGDGEPELTQEQIIAWAFGVGVMAGCVTRHAARRVSSVDNTVPGE